MKVLRGASERLEKIDAAADAARESLTTQSVLNVVLAVGVIFAMGVAAILLMSPRGGE